MLIYLADLTHDHFELVQYTPTGIGYIAAYAQAQLGDRVESVLFKSVEALLDACDERPPDLVGLTNYVWNAGLSRFAGRQLKARRPELPIVMGGPNIRTEEPGIEQFLREHEFVDSYCMFAGEVSFERIAAYLLDQPPSRRTARALREARIDGCYSLSGDRLCGNSNYAVLTELDQIPSPFLNGSMGPFLEQGCIPIFETNRGCPFSCTFCVWGIAALSRLRKFSLERVDAELSYVVGSGLEFPVLSFADANFGILKRDVEIARRIRELYDQTQGFSSVQLYWAKVALPQMIEIGRILGPLTQTYVAFQSLDPQVLENIKRKNISTDALAKMIEELSAYTPYTQTDILLGLPGESYASHLRSLDQALALGIDFIQGGEIKMLPGSEMDSPVSRERFGIRTKYRFYEGGYGVYRGQFVYELDESIRQTSAMSEEEMLELRVIRAFFYASVTLGEHRALVSHLSRRGVRFTRVCEELVAQGGRDPLLRETVEWLRRQAAAEWFDTIEDAARQVASEEQRRALLEEDQFVKLNMGLLARLYLDPEQYEAYYRVFEQVVREVDPAGDPVVLGELLALCRERNYLTRCLRGDTRREVALALSPATLDALEQIGFLDGAGRPETGQPLRLALNEATARVCREFVAAHRPMRLIDLTQMLLLQVGRFLLLPVRPQHARLAGSPA